MVGEEPAEEPPERPVDGQSGAPPQVSRIVWYFIHVLLFAIMLSTIYILLITGGSKNQCSGEHGDLLEFSGCQGRKVGRRQDWCVHAYSSMLITC
jgi:hypothetical protein